MHGFRSERAMRGESEKMNWKGQQRGNHGHVLLQGQKTTLVAAQIRIKRSLVADTLIAEFSFELYTLQNPPRSSLAACLPSTAQYLSCTRTHAATVCITRRMAGCCVCL